MSSAIVRRCSIAQVDPEKLHVIRSTERILIPERGAGLGNAFGVTEVNEHETWVHHGRVDARTEGDSQAWQPIRFGQQHLRRTDLVEATESRVGQALKFVRSEMNFALLL